MNQDYTAEQLCELYQKKHSDSAVLRARFERIARYADPANSGFNTEFNEGANVYADKRDSTMSIAGWKMARAFNTLMTDNSTKWFGLRFRDKSLNERDDAKEFLDSATEAMILELQNSNFYSSIYETWASYVFYNNACIEWMERKGQTEADGWPGLVFQNRHIGSVIILEDVNGLPGVTAVEYKLNTLQAIEKFGDAVSDDIREARDRNKLGAMHKFIHVEYRRNVREVEDVTKKIKPEDMPIASVHIELKHKRIVQNGGRMERRRVYARYQTMNGSDYGTGPGHEAVDEAEQLSRARELTFDEWEKSISPPIINEQGNITGNLNIGADGVTTVGRVDGIRELVTRRDKGYERFKFEESRQQIKDIFLWDHMDLPKREEVGQMTATEILKRLEKAFQALGPVTGRAARELLSPLIMSVFNRMIRAGRLGQFPDDIAGEQLDIDFIGPLARAQKMAEVEATERAQQELLDKIQAGAPPDLLDIIDWEEAEREKYRRLGVPATSIRSKEQVAEMQAKRAQAEQQARNMELAQQGASALKDANAAGIPPENVIELNG